LIASAFAVIAVTAVLVFAFDKYATQSLLDSVERQNVLLALFVANDLREQMPEHFATKFHHAAELFERHHVGHITEIDAVLKKNS
jgi:response regulator RpfG family c-di-GMP phosphodiesterase